MQRPDEPMGNQIIAIQPYKPRGFNFWAFDDERVGLVQEPFVGDTNRIIDWLVRNIKNASAGFSLIFSRDPFPGYQAMLQLAEGEDDMGGTWYFCEEINAKGWLCPALFLYFAKAPKELYVLALSKLDLTID